MKVIPAIDLLDGRVVRLRKGKREDVTHYDRDPVDLVREYRDEGAGRIHIVDLNGAFTGERQDALIAKLAAASDLPIQVGGGIRSQDALSRVLDAGASGAVLGTSALKDPAFAEKACRENPDKIIIAVDSIDGRVAIEGWQEASDITAVDLGKRAAGWGAYCLLYTDVERDGTEVGPNVGATAALGRETGLPVIASGGIGELEHIRKLAAAGVQMCVVGRALFEKRFTVADAVRVAEEAAC